MPVLPENYAAAMNAIQTWIRETLAAYDARWDRDDAVVRAEQDAPEPAAAVYPRASWKLTSPVRDGGSVEITTELAPTVARKVVEHDESATLTIDLRDRADPGSAVISVLPAALHLEASSRRSEDRDALRADGIVIVETLGKADRGELVGSRWVSRYVLDLRIRYRVQFAHNDADWIDVGALAPTIVTVDGADVVGEVGV